MSRPIDHWDQLGHRACGQLTGWSWRADLPIGPLDFVPSVRQSVRVTVALLMLLAMYAAGLLVFLSIALLAVRECCRRLTSPQG